MSNEFVNFLKIVGKAIKFILDLTINIICFALALVRIPCIWGWGDLGDLSEVENQNDFRGWCLIQFFKTIADCITIPLFLVSCCAFWRWSTYIYAFVNVEMDFGGRRLWFLKEFFITIADFISISFGLVSLLGFWNYFPMFRAYRDAFKKNIDDDGWNSEVRGVMCAYFFFFILDIIVFPFAVVSLSAIWRWPSYGRTIAEKCGDSDNILHYNILLRWYCAQSSVYFVIDLIAIPLSPFGFLSFSCLEYIRSLREAFKETTRADRVHYNWNIRKYVFKYFVHFVLDLFVIPTFLLIIITYRNRTLLEKMNNATGIRKRLKCLKEGLELLIDFPFLILFCIIMLTLWRSLTLYRELGNCNDWKEFRYVIFKQFCYLIRDICPFSIMFFMIIATLWRAFPMIIRLFSLLSDDVCNAKPLTKVKSMKVVFPAEGGTVLYFKLQRHQDMLLSTKPKNIKLNVAGSNLIPLVADGLGKTVATLVSGMLPHNLTDANVDISVLKALENPHILVDLVIHLPVKVKRTTFIKKLNIMKNKGRDAEVVLQLEYTDALNDKFVLCRQNIKPSQILSSAEENIDIVIERQSQVNQELEAFIATDEIYAKQKVEESIEQSTSFVDGFWIAVLAEFVEWVLDITHLLMFLFTILTPHRFIATIILLFEKYEQWPKRVRLKILQMSKMIKSIREEFLIEISLNANQYIKVYDVDDTTESDYNRNNHFYVSRNFDPLLEDCDPGSRIHTLKGRKNVDYLGNIRSAGVLYSNYLKLYKLIRKQLHRTLQSLQMDIPESKDENCLTLFETFIKFQDDLVYYKLLVYETFKHVAKNTLSSNGTDAIMYKIRYFENESENKLNNSVENINKRAEQLKTEIGIWKPCCKSFIKSIPSRSREIIKSMFFGCIFDLLALISIILVICTVYRSKVLLQNLKKATVWEWKRFVIYQQCFEIVIDLFMLMKIIFLIGTLYKAVDTLSDMLEQNSLSGVRQAVNKNVIELFNDMKTAFLNICLLWNTYKFVVSTIVWGILAPAGAVSTILESVISNNRIRRLISLILWLSFMIYPILLVLVIVPHFGVPLKDVSTSLIINNLTIPDTTLLFSKSNRESIATYLGVYLLLIFIIVIGSVIVASRNSQFLTIPHPSKVVHFTWPNLIAIGYLLFDLFQLASLPWLVLSLDNTVPTSKTFNRMQIFSESILLFNDSSFEPLFYLSLAAAILWFFLIAMPMVVERLMEWKEVGTFQKTNSWKWMVSLLATSMLYADATIDKTLQYGFLQGHQSEVCWNPNGFQSIMTIVALMAAVFFLLTSHVLTSDSDVLKIQYDEKLDIRSPYVYIMAINITKVLISSSIVLFAELPWYTLIFLLMGAIFLFLFTITFEHFFKTPPCCIPYVTQIRIGGALCIIVTTITAMIELANRELKNDDVDAWLLCLILLCIVIVYTLIKVINLRKKAVWEQENEMFKYHLQEYIDLLLKIEAEYLGFHSRWSSYRSTWRRKLKSSKAPYAIALRLIELDRAIKISYQTHEFLRARHLWLDSLNDGGKFVYLQELHKQLQKASIDDNNFLKRTEAKSDIIISIPNSSKNTANNAFDHHQIVVHSIITYGDVVAGLLCLITSLKEREITTNMPALASQINVQIDDNLKGICIDTSKWFDKAKDNVQIGVLRVESLLHSNEINHETFQNYIELKPQASPYFINANTREESKSNGEENQLINNGFIALRIQNRKGSSYGLKAKLIDANGKTTNDISLESQNWLILSHLSMLKDIKDTDKTDYVTIQILFYGKTVGVYDVLLGDKVLNSNEISIPCPGNNKIDVIAQLYDTHETQSKPIHTESINMVNVPDPFVPDDELGNKSENVDYVELLPINLNTPKYTGVLLHATYFSSDSDDKIKISLGDITKDIVANEKSFIGYVDLPPVKERFIQLEINDASYNINANQTFWRQQIDDHKTIEIQIESSNKPTDIAIDESFQVGIASMSAAP